MSKVFDCCMVYNELDMMELRFHILNDVVDYFVVVESGMTHSGQSKPRYFGDALEAGRFAEFEEKIVYSFTPTLEGANSWEREHFNRGLISGVLQYMALPDDWVIVGDADEIPNPFDVTLFREDELRAKHGIANPPDAMKFELKLYYYDFHHRVRQGWAIGACRWRVCQDANRIRTCDFGIEPGGFYEGGWHLSYFMSPEQVIHKLDAFMHHADVAKDVPRDVNWLKARMDAGQDIYERDLKIDTVPLSDSLPRYVLEHLDKYRALGWIEPVQEATWQS